MKIIAGDVGGTKVAIELGELDPSGGVGGAGYRVLAEARYESARAPDLETIVLEFLASLTAAHREGIDRACFGVAGPVKNGICKATNLPWIIEESSLVRRTGIPQVRLINDFVAVVLGVGWLGPDDVALLSDPELTAEPYAPIAVLGAGTGLGQAFLVWNGLQYDPLPSEGGHVDFAPRDELEIDLLRFLWRKLGGHVSYERLVSGQGITNIHEFMQEASRAGQHGLPRETDAATIAVAAAADKAAAVAEWAGKGDALCQRTLRLFASIYGAEAGNMVLKVMASGGVFLAGGIAPKLLPTLKEGGFMRAFLDKGRLSPLCAQAPVRVILHKRTALLGAAAGAARLGG